MTERKISWPLVVAAVLCAVPVAGGVALLFAGDSGSQALAWALVGFFGSGVVVLGRKAFGDR